MPVTLNVTIPEDAPDAASFTLVFTSNEGVQATAIVNMDLRAAVPAPTFDRTQIKVGINPDDVHTETVTLTNVGLGTMSGITLIPPGILPWVTLVGLGTTVLAPGASTTFQIQIAPTDAVVPGTYGDYIVATDGTTRATLALTVEVTPSQVGSVYFVLTDDSGQVVPGASVRVVGREELTATYGNGTVSTYHNVFYATADSQGVAKLENVPIDDYDYSVTADRHEKLTGEVSVMPESDAQIIPLTMTTIVLSYQWTVTPIVIEDRYDITLNLDFHMDEVTPAFVCLAPWICIPPTVTSDIYDQVTIVNPSVIAINDVTVSVVGLQGITLSSQGEIGTMAPGSSVVVGYHVAPGNYANLTGASTYFQVSGDYISTTTGEEKTVQAQIGLFNPSQQQVQINTGIGPTMDYSMPEGGDGEDVPDFGSIDNGGGGGDSYATVTLALKPDGHAGTRGV